MSINFLFEAGVGMSVNLTYLSRIKGWEATDSAWLTNSAFLLSNQSGMILLGYDKSSLIDKTHKETAEHIEENKKHDSEIKNIEAETNPILKQRKIAELHKKMALKTYNPEQFEYLRNKSKIHIENANKLNNEFNEKIENQAPNLSSSTKEKINTFIKSGEYSKEVVDNFIADIENQEPKTANEISEYVYASIKNRAMSEIMLGLSRYYNKSAEIYALRQSNKLSDKLNKIELDNINLYKQQQLNSEFSYDREAFHDPLSPEGDVWRANNDTTNCFAYAANDPLGHSSKPSPGEKSGLELKSCSGVHVAGLAKRDGFAPAMIDENNLPIQKKGFYLVALVSDRDDKDYHWYRQNQDGTWSHKIGNRLPKNQDESGKTIIDVESADRGSYTEFVGYFYVPKGGIAIGKKALNENIANTSIKNSIISKSR